MANSVNDVARKLDYQKSGILEYQITGKPDFVWRGRGLEVTLVPPVRSGQATALRSRLVSVGVTWMTPEKPTFSKVIRAGTGTAVTSGRRGGTPKA
jgi:hypothetical protein